MKDLWKYFKPYRLFLALTFVVKLTGTVTELFIPALLAKIIVADATRESVLFYGGLMALSALLTLIFNMLANWMAAQSSGKITGAIRQDLFSRIAYLSCAQIDRYTVSSLVSRLTSDSYSVNRMIAMVQRIGVRAPIMLIGGIVVTMSLSLPMTLVMVALLPFVSLVILTVTRRGLPLYTEKQRLLDDVVGTVQENATGVRVVKALSRTEYERKRFHDRSSALSGITRKAGRVMGITQPVNTLLLNLGLCVILVVGAWQVNIGAIETGVILAFLSYFTTMLMTMMGITRVFVECTQGLASARRIGEILTAEYDMPVQELPPISTPYHIEFRHVSFSYHKKQPDLQGLSFSLFKGQTLGVIGATGSGKSTLISLLLRFYDVDEGCILINGRDVKSIPKQELYTMFGVTFQHDFLRQGSVADNLALDRTLDAEDLKRAAADACALGFIEAKDGLDGHVAIRGGNFSGGQKQRLLIARALAAKPPVLILDDASSALDYQTDLTLRRSLRASYAESTKIIVAQRVSSIRHADVILVLEEGRVIGKGKHEDLLADCPTYAAIAESQLASGHLV